MNGWMDKQTDGKSFILLLVEENLKFDCMINNIA